MQLVDRYRLATLAALGQLVLGACAEWGPIVDDSMSTSEAATTDGSTTVAGSESAAVEMCGDAELEPGFVCVAEGPYVRGCANDCVARPEWFPTGSAEPNYAAHFAPVDHEFVLGTYQIMQLEVTTSQYSACVDAGTCPMPACVDSSGTWPFVEGEESKAITCVGAEHASAFCTWQGEQLGLEGSLPTECQWEKAARGTIDGRPYSTGSTPPTCDTARIGLYGSPPPCAGDDGADPVGSHPNDASPFGLLDLAGNVQEWTSSRASGESGDWVLKGGNWALNPTTEIVSARVDFRFPARDDEGAIASWGSTLGMRCVIGSASDDAALECPPPPIP